MTVQRLAQGAGNAAADAKDPEWEAQLDELERGEQGGPALARKGQG